MPAFRDDVVKVAVPPLSVPVPSKVFPWLKDTVSPSGGAPALDVTVAVKVTASPKVDGFGDEVSPVLVGTVLTVL